MLTLEERTRYELELGVAWPRLPALVIDGFRG
jgi:hypothetical protein